jgi:hypothetical protein
MKLSATATLLLSVASTCPAQQTPVQLPNPTAVEVQNYSLGADSFIEALLKIAAQFQFPLGVELTKTADTLKPIRFSRSRATVADIIESVVSMQGYEWRTEDGVVHVFQRDLVKDNRNPLNITISAFDQWETVGFADNELSQRVSHVARHPETSGDIIVVSVLFNPGEPVYSFAAQNAPARSILNKIVTAGLASSVPGPQQVWIATFPESPVLSRTGYLETLPVWNPDAVPVQEQPFWVLLPWGHPPPEKMVR